MVKVEIDRAVQEKVRAELPLHAAQREDYRLLRRVKPIVKATMPWGISLFACTVKF
jgi:hypothetical protein